METNIGENEESAGYSFKSYYVVWKPVWVLPKEKYHFVFKSYYVVWKPTKRASAVPIPTKFKSYYVVWKLFFPANAFFATPGLNRTM